MKINKMMQRIARWVDWLLRKKNALEKEFNEFMQYAVEKDYYEKLGRKMTLKELWKDILNGKLSDFKAYLFSRPAELVDFVKKEKDAEKKANEKLSIICKIITHKYYFGEAKIEPVSIPAPSTEPIAIPDVSAADSSTTIDSSDGIDSSASEE